MRATADSEAHGLAEGHVSGSSGGLTSAGERSACIPSVTCLATSLRSESTARCPAAPCGQAAT